MIDNLVQHLLSLGTFYYYPNYGNIGDLLIAEGTRQFFKRHNINYIEYDKNRLPDKYNLVYGGGGYFVRQWADESASYELLADPRIEKCIILPHSFRGVDHLMARLDDRHHLYCRDQASLDYCQKHAPQCHSCLHRDMGFELNIDDLPPLLHPKNPSTEEKAIAKCIKRGLFKQMKRGVMRATATGRNSLKGKRIAFLLRTDRERASFVDAHAAFDLPALWNGTCRETAYNGEILRQFSEAINQVDLIVSDRLHVCIMAYLNGLEVYMLDNTYGKLSGVYKQALVHEPKVHLLNQGTFPTDLQTSWDALLRKRNFALARTQNFERACAPVKNAYRILKRPFCNLIYPTIRVSNLHVNHGKLTVHFTLSHHKNLRNFFAPEHTFEAEYTHDLGKVPQGILLIPFITNVLPVAWLLNAKLIVPELDKEFYHSIAAFKEGYKNMAPMLKFKGKVEAERLIDYSYKPSRRAGTFFSGGVDAYCTLLRHLQERPSLLTILGADIKENDTTGWETACLQSVKTARLYGLPEPEFVRSNFRTFLNEGYGDYLVAASNDGYWHGFQHGIGLIGLAAPLAYIQRWNMCYIASSFTKHDHVICASSPSIDNHVRLSTTAVCHDGYELSRQQKLQYIARSAHDSGYYPKLRVCWKSDGGQNCGLCEKCIRTIYGLLAEGEDPRNYGFENFDINSHVYRAIIQGALPSSDLFVRRFWLNIQTRFAETQAFCEIPTINWIYQLQIDLHK